MKRTKPYWVSEAVKNQFTIAERLRALSDQLDEDAHRRSRTEDLTELEEADRLKRSAAAIRDALKFIEC